MMSAVFDLQVITLADLRSDQHGNLITELAEIIRAVFSEPPWHERYSEARLKFGLGVEMMRKNPILIIARHKHHGDLAAYSLGQELVANSEDPRDQTFFKISGAHELDYLADHQQRTFYVSGLGVKTQYRRLGVAEQLSSALIAELRRQQFDYRLGRTDLNAHGMRRLYAKQGFKELPIRDVNYPERSYWLLPLK